MIAGSEKARRLVRAVPGRQGDRVTTLELFFDLAFVFAFTQLSRLMAQEHSALGVVEALIVLALLWWAWTSFGWLANIARADEGVVRLAMITGMIAMFVAGLTVLEAFEDRSGGLSGPVVFVSAYLVARLAHAVVFVALAEPALRRRTLLTVTLSVAPSGALLIAGALLGAPWQLWCALAAAAIEPIVSYRSSIGVAWPVRSTVHFTERHGLIVILALGESILGIGAGASAEPIGLGALVGVVVSMLICVLLWWAYFARLSRTAEHALSVLSPEAHGRAATDAYTYLHLMLVGGIVITALGLESAMAHITEAAPLGLFGAAALGGGVACYLAGTAFFGRRLLRRWDVTRLAFATVSALVVPGLAAVAPVVALAGTAALLIGLLLAERIVVARRGAAAPASQPV